MSARASGWVWDHSPYRGLKLVVHLALADVVNDQHQHEFWMAQANLAEKCRCTRTEVSRVLNQMVADGYLAVLEDNSRAGRPSRFRFLYHQADGDGCADSAQGVCAERTRNSNELNIPVPPVPDASALVAVAEGEAPWKVALSQHAGKIEKAKSFDAMQPFMAAWDDLWEMDLPATARAGNAIALTIAYIEFVTGEPLEARHRAMVAKTVRQHGKVALFAWDKALFATESDTPRDRMAYARGIINRVIAEQAKEAS